MNGNLFFDHALLSYCSKQLVNQSRMAGFSIASRQNARLDGEWWKLSAATCMPLQALFLDEMIDNDTELITLNSNDDDIFGEFKISEFGITLFSCYSCEAFFIQDISNLNPNLLFVVSLL